MLDFDSIAVMRPVRLPSWLQSVSRVLLVVCLIGITVLSLAPLTTSGPEGGDKVAHFVAYFVLGLLVVLSLPRAQSGAGWFIALVGAAVVYGVLIEVLQRFVGRDFDLVDMAANALGALAGAAGGKGLSGLVEARMRRE